MLSTKQRIIKIAEKLFFENGIANTRLQQIADESGISVGNLAYHFKNKEAIVEATYKQVFSELSRLLRVPLKHDDLSQFNVFFDAIFQFVNTNLFCFNNVWEIARNHPNIQRQWEIYGNKLLVRTHQLMDFHVKRGDIREEPYKGAYDLLTQQLIISFLFWLPHQVMRGMPATSSQFTRYLWNLLFPNLTHQGIVEYKQLISDDVLQ